MNDRQKEMTECIKEAREVFKETDMVVTPEALTMTACALFGRNK